MNIHEYQAKDILSRFGVAVPAGIVVDHTGKAEQAALDVQKTTKTVYWVVKAQIHAGGRGKGGGIKLARNLEEVRKHASAVIGMQLVTPQTGSAGKKVHKVLIQQDIYYPGDSPVKELYISVLSDRSSGRNIIMYSTEGGMDIESVAEQTPDLIFKEEINPVIGIQPFQARKIAYNLGLEGKAFKEMTKFVTALYRAYIASDAALIEINPLVKTSDDLIYAADAKINLDDNALFRHPDYENLRDLNEENPSETEASKNNLNFIKLNGNVGCMVNGAGLAMATMDIIKLSGGEPANFLDVGGSANAQTVEAGFRIILQDPSVQVILINIFGGIVRCDRVAQGVIDACNSLGTIPVPVIVRLQGTNSREAKTLIDRSGLKVYFAVTLQDAADMVRKCVN
jgi:succinyl-CoA synthetase beta subunit